MNNLLDNDTMEVKTASGKSVMAVCNADVPLETLAQDDVAFSVMPYLVREISATSFASEATVNTNTVTLAAGHGDTGARLEVIIQDNLTGGVLEYMEGTISGHKVEK